MFNRRGAKLILAARSTDKLRELADQLTNQRADKPVYQPRILSLDLEDVSFYLSLTKRFFLTHACLFLIRLEWFHFC
jgi:short-subunit dehydrogenase